MICMIWMTQEAAPRDSMYDMDDTRGSSSICMIWMILYMYDMDDTIHMYDMDETGGSSSRYKIIGYNYRSLLQNIVSFVDLFCDFHSCENRKMYISVHINMYDKFET